MGYLESILQLSGLSDVSAVCTLDISASTFENIYEYELDVSHATDICASTLKIGVSDLSASPPFNNILFSESICKAGHSNTHYEDQRVFKDVIRRVSYEIIGSYSATDIYTNEGALSLQVKNEDVSLCDKFNSIISTTSSLGLKTRQEYEQLTSNQDAQQLYALGDKLLGLILDGSQNDPISFSTLETKMTSAYQNSGNTLPIRVKIGFPVGTYIGVRIEYHPSGNTNNLYSNFTPISYKCLMKMV